MYRAYEKVKEGDWPPLTDEVKDMMSRFIKAVLIRETEKLNDDFCDRREREWVRVYKKNFIRIEKKLFDEAYSRIG